MLVVIWISVWIRDRIEGFFTIARYGTKVKIDIALGRFVLSGCPSSNNKIIQNVQSVQIKESKIIGNRY